MKSQQNSRIKFWYWIDGEATNIYPLRRYFLILFYRIATLSTNKYKHKVNDRNTRKRCETSLELLIKIPEQSYWSRFGVFIVDFGLQKAGWVPEEIIDKYRFTRAIHEIICSQFLSNGTVQAHIKSMKNYIDNYQG